MAAEVKEAGFAADCIAQAGQEIRQLKRLLFLSLVVNVALTGTVIVVIVLG